MRILGRKIVKRAVMRDRKGREVFRGEPVSGRCSDKRIIAALETVDRRATLICIEMCVQVTCKDIWSKKTVVTDVFWYHPYPILHGKKHAKLADIFPNAVPVHPKLRDSVLVSNPLSS